MTDWHLAQLNVGTARYDLEDPGMAGFMNRLDEINAIAEESPGFVWRLQSDSGNATDIDVGRGDRFIINLSVWESVEALFEFAYRTAHQQLLTQRREWFEHPGAPYQVMWWVPTGHEPTIEEGLAKLDELIENGPGPEAFTFRSRYPAPDENTKPDSLEPDPYCSGWE